MAEPQPLFARSSLHDYLAHRRAAMRHEIQQLDLAVLTADDPSWRQHLENKYHLQPLQLGTDIDPVECTDTFLNLAGTAEGARWGNPSRVPGHQVTYAIPFQGHHELFHCTPSTFAGTPPIFVVTETALRAIIRVPKNTDPAEIRRQLDRELDNVRQHITWMSDDIRRYNTALPSFIDRCIADRKKEHAEKTAFNTALGLKDPPPASRAEAPAKAASQFSHSPFTPCTNSDVGSSKLGVGCSPTSDLSSLPSVPGRALLPQRLPSEKPSEHRAETSAKAAAPTSALRSLPSVPIAPCTNSDVGSSKLGVGCSSSKSPTSDIGPLPSVPPHASHLTPAPLAPADHFTRIMKRIFNAARTIERNPKAWRDCNENTLRDILMTVISGDYPIVNGEANSGDGRSDILVQDAQGRTLFIGECKKWKGRESLVSGVKQLLSYANWRDRNLGLIIFVTAGSIAEIPRMIDRVFPECPYYHGPFKGPQEDGIYRHLFSFPEDPRCIVQIAVVLLHVHRLPEV